MSPVRVPDCVIVARLGFTWPARSIDDALALAASPFGAIPMTTIGIAGVTNRSRTLRSGAASCHRLVQRDSLERRVWPCPSLHAALIQVAPIRDLDELNGKLLPCSHCLLL